MSIKIFQVDAFTSEPFKGNPAAVCLLDEPRADKWMRDVAREMNLSETAFLTPYGDEFRLRWFAPRAEVDLCGHATLASASVLWEEGVLAEGETARFVTRSGPLSAEKRGDLIEMDFPAEPERAVECSPPMLEAALGARFSYVGENRFDLLVELDSGEVLRQLRPKFNLMKKLPSTGGDRNEHERLSRSRLRLPVLRSCPGGRRGPGDGIGPLLSWATLGRKARETGACGLPGLGAGRRRTGPGGRRRRSGRFRRRGGDGHEGRVGRRSDRKGRY
jgi:hypothetical protein